MGQFIYPVVSGENIRTCIDPQELNKGILRENYPISTIEEVVSEIPGAKVLDAKSAYMQIGLDYESSLLTTFHTPLADIGG